MARRRGVIAEFQTELQRQRVQQERAQRAAQRERERLHRERLRLAAAEEKEAKRLYAEARTEEAANAQREVEQRLDELDTLLIATLSVDDYIDLEKLKPRWRDQPFDARGLDVPIPEPEEALPAAPTGFRAALPGSAKRHSEALASAERDLAAAREEHARLEAQRQAELTRKRAAHDAEVTERRKAHDEQIQAIDALIEGLGKRSPEAAAEYFGLVLNQSKLPDYLPRWHRLAYSPESSQLVVEVELPTADVVPNEKTFRYVKARDEITSTARSQKDAKDLYARVLQQLALRTVHELFEADRSGLIETLVYNGIVDSVDPRTGQPSRVCVISLRTTADRFSEIDLSRVEPAACLRHLNAAVSKSPTELAAVRPVLEFDMVDSRFVEESDVLGSLDQRPNLMELSPTEFESLITNLFSEMGLDTRQTQASRDGGVDCVAFDPRPIFGGRVIIQAKRYKNTVGVSAVRDLFGTVQNEGASKGILVTTSGYGKASFEFAEGKPLELLDGSNLLFLLAEHAGIEARIEVPDDWSEPAPVA